MGSTTFVGWCDFCLPFSLGVGSVSAGFFEDLFTFFVFAFTESIKGRTVAGLLSGAISEDTLD